jgi:hypothetical protein
LKHFPWRAVATLFAAAIAVPCNAASFTLAVGPSETYQTLGAAARAEVAGNSYTINMDPGTYSDADEFAEFVAPTVLNAVGVTITTTTPPPNLKGVLTTTFPLTVNGLTFIATPDLGPNNLGSGISAADGGNSSAIREQSNTANTLIVNGVTIENFQEGILTGSDSGAVYLDQVTIINSQIINNGNPDPTVFQHGVYIGDAASLTVMNSLFCGQLLGHDLKSRAASSTVVSSTLFVGTNQGAPTGCNIGSASNAINLPNGGAELIDKNKITVGDANQNGNLIDYGGEGYVFAADSLVVTKTKFTNVGSMPATGIFIFPDTVNNIACPVTVSVSSDRFTGNLTPVIPTACSIHGKHH